MEIKDLNSADAVVDSKNADVVQAVVDDGRAIQATPSGYGDRMDIDRTTDRGTFRDGLTIEKIRANNKALRDKGAPKLQGFAKNAAIQNVTRNIDGQDEAADQQEGVSLIQQARSNSYHLANQQAAAGVQPQRFADDMQLVKQAQDIAVEAEKQKQGTGFGDMVGAAFDQTTAIPALLQSMNRPEYPADPTYDYNTRRDSVELGLNEEDRQFMRQSRSLAEEQARMAEVKTRQEDFRKLSAHGPYWAVAASLTGGIIDPVGWGVGLGVGKAAQVVGLGSRAAFLSGQATKGVALGAAEGTVGNLAITGLVDAAGGHVTDRDYAYAAGFGLAFGGLGAAAGMRSASAEGLQARVAAATDELVAARDAQMMDAHVMMQQAREKAGMKVTDVEPDESITAAVNREIEDIKFDIDLGEVTKDMARLKGTSPSAHAELERIAQSADPLLAAQAQYLRGLIGDDVEMLTSKSITFSGERRAHYHPGEDKIKLNVDDTDATILHEITHSMTLHRMAYGLDNPETAIGTLTKEFEALRLMAADAVEKSGKKAPADSKYLTRNIDEFAAGLFTADAKHMEFLNNIPVKSDGKSLLKAVVTTMRRILGIPADRESLLTRALHINDELLNTPVRLDVDYHATSSKRKGSEAYVKSWTRYIGAEQHRAGAAIQESATAASLADLQQVAPKVANNPDPAAVQVELDNLMRQRYADAMNIVHARVSNGSMFMPGLAEPTVREDGNVVYPSEVLLPKNIRENIGAAWGIDDALVANAGDVQVLTEIAARATRWAAENPVDAARVDSILGKMPWLASTGLQLAKSKHPVAQMIAGVLLENTTGALGRGRTAALDKNLLQRQYNEYLSLAEQHYTAWRNRNNGNIATDMMSGEMRDRFMREVSQEIRSREDNGFGASSDADVRGYADQLERGFDRMRVDQQTRNTIGAARLGDSSRGYSPRRISKQWARGATLEQRRALSREFADQLDAVWGDRAFADRVASGYVERARAEAGGGVQPPTNLYSDEASDILKDVMRSGGVPDEQIDRLLGKFSRGGQSFTKKRLDLDLDKTVRTEAGDEFRLADAFEHDQSKLYQDYARRVSGEVALANYGVYGKHGLMMLRRSMADFGPNGVPATIDEIKAFDQIAAEFYGTPLPGTGNKALGNLRLLSSMSMLGGMAFNQLAEFSNSLPLLGLGGAMRFVADMPKLIRDAHTGRQSPLLESIELVGGPIGQDQKVIFPYQDMDDTQVWGAADLNAFDRVLRAGSQAMPWLSGFHFVHAAQLRGISEQIVMKSLRYILEDREQVALASMGFNESLRFRIQADLPNIARFDESGRLIELDITKSNDPDAMNEFVQAVHRGSKQIIQGTYIGETGAWAHNDLLRLLTQFRTFSLTSMEKQWSRTRADQGTIKAMGLLLGTMGFAIPIQAARIQLNALNKEDPEAYRERQLAPGLFARNLLNYSSISGTLGDIIDSGAALTGHSVSGGRSGQQGSAADVVPGIGYINNLVQGIKERDPRELLRALPGQNLPFLVPLVNMAE